MQWAVDDAPTVHVASGERALFGFAQGADRRFEGQE